MSVPNPKEISYASVLELSELYPDLLKDLYKEPNTEKYKKALDDDKWRYETLPAQVKEKREKGEKVSFNLKELERVVQWKIKHGKTRPFLIGMIRKNDTATITKVTKDVFATLPKAPTITVLLDALKNLNAIKGVGPATGSLLLSIYEPDGIPFFEDELYIWLCHHETMEKGSEVKLKYTTKEYEELWKAFQQLKQRLEKEAGKPIPAWILERVAFVIGNKKGSKETTKTKDNVKSEPNTTEIEEKKPIPPASRSSRKRSTDAVQPDPPAKRRSGRTK